MLKNLKVKQNTAPERSISFDFVLRIFLGPAGSEKAVDFFSLARNGVSIVSRARGGDGDEINFPQNK